LEQDEESHKAQVEDQEFAWFGLGKHNSKARICITFLIAFEELSSLLWEERMDP